MGALSPHFLLPKICFRGQLDFFRGLWYVIRGNKDTKGEVYMKKTDYDYLMLFSSPTCPQCRGLKQSLKKTGLEYEESADYDTYNIDHLPTLILMEAKKYHRHEEAKRHVGFMTENELNEFVKGSSCGRRIELE